MFICQRKLQGTGKVPQHFLKLKLLTEKVRNRQLPCLLYTSEIEENENKSRTDVSYLFQDVSGQNVTYTTSSTTVTKLNEEEPADRNKETENDDVRGKITTLYNGSTYDVITSNEGKTVNSNLAGLNKQDVYKRQEEKVYCQ